VLAPLQELSKAQILARARALGVPVERTLSCYDPDSSGAACGRCDACRLRARAERELGGGA
jgi:7-cyano-7-deazaguanine synthase